MEQCCDFWALTVSCGICVPCHCISSLLCNCCECSTHREQKLFPTISRVCITHLAAVLGGLSCVLESVSCCWIKTMLRLPVEAPHDPINHRLHLLH